MKSVRWFPPALSSSSTCRPIWLCEGSSSSPGTSSSGSSPRKTRSTRSAKRGRLTLPPTLTRVSVPRRSSQSVVIFSRKRDSAISASPSISPKKLSTQRVSAMVRSVANRWLESTHRSALSRAVAVTFSDSSFWGFPSLGLCSGSCVSSAFALRAMQTLSKRPPMARTVFIK